MKNHYSTDIIVVGAGPVGLFTVFQAGMLNMRCHVVDALEFIGGQCTALYPEKPIYDIPAHPHISAEDLIQQLEKQAAPFKPIYHLGERADSLKPQLDKNQNTNWILTTSTGTVIHAKAIIIAAGCGAFGPNRPPLDHIANYEGTSVFYMVGKRDFFRNKRVVIAGGGDSAADWALVLSKVAKRVTMVHRRNKFRCTPDSHRKLMELAENDGIDLAIPYQLHALEGRGKQLTAVLISSMEGELEIDRIEADILLPFFGLSMELGSIRQWGLQFDDQHHILVNPATMETSQRNIFAVGDVARYPNKLKLILSGFAETAMACHAVRTNLFPESPYHFEYSTTSGIPAFSS